MNENLSVYQKHPVIEYGSTVTTLWFAKKDAYWRFKNYFLGEKDGINFNKYIPVDPNVPNDELNKWGSLNAFNVEWDDKNVCVEFATVGGFPFYLMDKWSKENPDDVIMATSSIDNGNLNDYGVYGFKDGEKFEEAYTQQYITQEDYDRDPEGAWDTYYNKFFAEDIINKMTDVMAKLSEGDMDEIED